MAHVPPYWTTPNERGAEKPVEAQLQTIYKLMGFVPKGSRQVEIVTSITNRPMFWLLMATSKKTFGLAMIFSGFLANKRENETVTRAVVK